MVSYLNAVMHLHNEIDWQTWNTHQHILGYGLGHELRSWQIKS